MAAYDVIVIGGGPGGYVAAIRAAQLGQKTAAVERDKAGGRCLNYACIPAKTVLHTAEVFAQMQEEGSDLGVKASGVAIDWPAVQTRRARVSKTLEEGVEFLWNKNKVDFLKGEASLAGGGKVKVGSDEHEAKAIVLATGSVALSIPGIDFSDRVIDTWERLVAREDAQDPGRRRRRRLGSRDRLRLRPHGGGGDAGRDARSAAAAGGQGHGAGGRAPVQEGRHGAACSAPRSKASPSRRPGSR